MLFLHMHYWLHKSVFDFILGFDIKLDSIQAHFVNFFVVHQVQLIAKWYLEENHLFRLQGLSKIQGWKFVRPSRVVIYSNLIFKTIFQFKFFQVFWIVFESYVFFLLSAKIYALIIEFYLILEDALGAEYQKSMFAFDEDWAIVEEGGKLHIVLEVVDKSSLVLIWQLEDTEFGETVVGVLVEIDELIWAFDQNWALLIKHIILFHK